MAGSISNSTDSQVFKLIDVWGDENIQEQLEGSKRNEHVYERISNSLCVNRIEKSNEQCRTKVKKLRQEFKKIKDNPNQTGNDRKKWKFYDRINKILGKKPSVTPPMVLDTLDSSTLSTEKVTSEEETRESKKDTRENSDEEDSSNTQDQVAVKPISSAKDNDCVIIKSKVKRKRAKAEIMEEVMTKILKTVTDGFKETDKMMVELEEKQMKFEERMRKQYREFQMEMKMIAICHHPIKVSIPCTNHTIRKSGVSHNVQVPLMGHIYQ